MINSIYREAVEALSEALGSFQDLPSGNGARFKIGSAYLLTIYHADIADDNLAEIAFKPNSFSQIESVCALTEHPVLPNQRYNWPRVGIRTSDEVMDITEALRAAIA